MEKVETAHNENHHQDLQQPNYVMQRHGPFHISERSENSLGIAITTSVTNLELPKSSMQNLPPVISPRQRDQQQTLPDSFIVPLVLKLTNMRKLE